MVSQVKLRRPYERETARNVASPTVGEVALSALGASPHTQSRPLTTIIDDTHHLCRVALFCEAHGEQRWHWKTRNRSLLAARHLFQNCVRCLCSRGAALQACKDIFLFCEAHDAVQMFPMVSPMVKNRAATSPVRGTPPGHAVNDKNESRKGEQVQHRRGPTLRVPRRSRGGTNQPLNRQGHAYKSAATPPRVRNGPSAPQPRSPRANPPR